MSRVTRHFVLFAIALLPVTAQALPAGVLDVAGALEVGDHRSEFEHLGFPVGLTRPYELLTEEGEAKILFTRDGDSIELAASLFGDVETSAELEAQFFLDEAARYWLLGSATDLASLSVTFDGEPFSFGPARHGLLAPGLHTLTLHASGGPLASPQVTLRLETAPVPEPSTVAIGVMAVGAFAWWRRRATRQRDE